MSVFLDTNILVYAAGRDHPHKEPCLAVLRAVASGALSATTSAEVAKELLHLFSRRNQREGGVRLTRHLLDLIPDPLPIDGLVVVRLCDLALKYPCHSARDLLHLATMLHYGIDRIFSVDADFDAFPEVQRIDPGTFVSE